MVLPYGFTIWLHYMVSLWLSNRYNELVMGFTHLLASPFFARPVDLVVWQSISGARPGAVGTSWEPGNRPGKTVEI